MNLSPLPIQKFFSNIGLPLVGGRLFTYIAGTSTKVDTYTNAGGTLNSNPIVLNFRGECRLWIDPQKAYKFILAPPGFDDPPTNPIWTVDDITAAPQAFDNASVDTGSVNNISLSIPQISSPVAFTRVAFKAAHTNTGATTLQINGGTALPVILQQGDALTGGEISQDGIYQAIFDGGNWQLQSQLKFDRTVAEVSAGIVPVSYSYPPYNAFRYMSATKIANVLSRALTLDVSSELQNCIDAANEAGADVTLPGGSYLIETGLVGYSNMKITGAPRDSTLIYYNGATTLAAPMLKFSNKSSYAVRFVGFRCGRVQAGNATVMLHCEDAVYVEISDCTFGGGAISSTSNEITGILCDQTTTGFVPPRGNFCIRNILYVFETPTNGAAGSYGIRIKGHASEAIINVVLEGEGDIEHAAYGISFEHVNNSVIGAWQLRGSSSAEIRMQSCALCKVDSPQVIPIATTGTGITIDNACSDNLLLNIGWNISSGVPLAVLVDNGAGTTVWPAGNPGSGQNFQGKVYGPLKYSKADGVAPIMQLVRNSTDTTVSGMEILKSGQALGAPAFFGIDIGTGIGGMDIQRFEAGTTTLERMDGNGRRYLCAPATDPGAISMTPSQITFYLDEAGNNLKVRVQYANGSTNKIGTIAIV